MYQTIKSFKRMLVFGMALIMPMLMAANNTLGMDMAESDDMASHHQHMMLNHALSMTLDGYNLVMMADMGMAKGVDESAVEHGKMMIKNGTDMFTETMSGETMLGMHHEGKDPMKDPGMAYTHKLAEKELIVMDLLSKMPKMGSGTGMTVHHQHIMLNHALQMALEGSNSFMLGQMDMSKGIDEISIEHGKMMLKNAKALFNEIMSGEDMMKMHKEGTTPESDALMGYTHKLAEAELQVMTLLEEMPGVK
jgi:hypothetical protein